MLFGVTETSNNAAQFGHRNKLLRIKLVSVKNGQQPAAGGMLLSGRVHRGCVSFSLLCCVPWTAFSCRLYEMWTFVL